MNAPRRLLDDPSAPEALRDDLRVAAEAEPRYDAERGLLALQAAMVTLGQGAPLAEGVRQAASSAAGQAGATGQAGAAGHAAGVGQAAAAAKVGGVLAGASASKLTIAAVATALGLAGTVAWMRGGDETSAMRPAPAASAPAAAPVVVPVPVSAAAPAPAEAAAVPAPVEPAVPAVAPEAVPAAETERKPAATPRAPRLHRAVPAAPVDPDLALRREIDHLARVRALLEDNPRAAYQLAQAGNRTLSSMFRQERDGLSVLALDAAGEHARARRLARTFLKRNPDSPLHERIAQLLEPAAETR